MLYLERDEMNARRDIYGDFGRDVVAPRAERLYETGEFDHTAWQELAALGFWRIAVPAEYGGQGGTWHEFAEALEDLARTARDLGFLLSLIAHAGLLRAVVEFGTEAQRRRFLPRLMA